MPVDNPTKKSAAKRKQDKPKSAAKSKPKTKSKAKPKVAAGGFRKQRDIRKPKKGKPGNGKTTYT